MKHTGSRKKLIVGGLTAALFFAGVASANVTNGGFETGTFQGWQHQDSDGGMVKSKSKGKWQVYKGLLKMRNIAPRGGGGGRPAKLQEPPEGKFAAGLYSLGPGTHILSQDVSVNRKSTLSMDVAYNNTANDFVIGDGLDSSGGDNQQLRIDLMVPGAPIDSTDGADIAKKIFATKPGDKRKQKYETLTATVNPGDYVLRIAEVDNRSNFLVGVDDVKLKAK